MKPVQVAIARAARWMRWGVSALIGLTILMQGLALSGSWPLLKLHRTGGGLMSGAIGIAHAVLIVVALVQLVRLFQHLERGELFSAGVTLRLRRFALLTMLAVLSIAVLHPVLAILLPDCGPHGPCVRRVPIDMRGLWSLIICLLFFLVARILDEGRRIEEENSQII